MDPRISISSNTGFTNCQILCALVDARPLHHPALYPKGVQVLAVIHGRLTFDPKIYSTMLAKLEEDIDILPKNNNG